ncbi:ABC transporter substrate-binding protein [Agrococcus sp. DT81.2]|uniref:ABC transporter substrate-binding protein n=1 Tax=Agrococcus sp. DT81.2 TaxID=3393414 RepID=UPI003CE52738
MARFTSPTGSRGRALRAVVGAAAAAALLATAGCSAGSAQPAPGAETPGAQALDVIRIATPTAPGNPAGIPIWIGELNGYFAEENLDVEVVTFPGRPSDAVSTVVSGQADLVIAVPDALIAPTANGDELNLTWAFTPYQRPSFAIAVPADSAVETAADLAGRTIALPALGAPYETFLGANLRAEGADPASVTPVAMQANASLEALRTGDIDAVVLNRGDLAHASEIIGLETKALPLAPSVEDDIAAGFMMRTDSTAEERDVYARYLRAYTKSAVFAQANPEAALEMGYELYPETRPTEEGHDAALVAMLSATVSEFQPGENGQWGYISEERWASYVADRGFADAIPDVTELYDYALLESVSDFDAEAVKAEAEAFQR